MVVDSTFSMEFASATSDLQVSTESEPLPRTLGFTIYRSGPESQAGLVAAHSQSTDGPRRVLSHRLSRTVATIHVGVNPSRKRD